MHPCIGPPAAPAARETMQLHSDAAPHFEHIKQALQDKIGTELDEADLRDEFQKYLDYGVPADQAARTILRHHGHQPGGTAPQATGGSGDTEQPRTTLADAPGNTPYVNLLARVVSYNTKLVHARGEDKEIVWGMLGDETATRPYTSWRPLEGVEKGDVLEIKGAYTKEFRGEVQINFGDRTQVEKKDPDALPKTVTEFRDTAVAELAPGLRNVRVTGRILDVSSRDITVQGQPKTIYGGTLADESGKIEFTAWADLGLVADSVVTIEGGYVRTYRNTPQFNFDQDATVTPAQVDLPDADTLADTPPVALHELTEQGANDVCVVATLLEVRDGSGLVFRDPETNRVVPTQTETTTPDLRVKGVLDDGTAAMNLIANRELTEQLLGKTLEQCQAEAKAAFRPEVIQDELRQKLPGRVYKARGNVLVDDFGAMFIAKTLTPFEGDLEEPAKDLLARLGGDA